MNNEIFCENCKKTFKTKYTLNTHRKTSKKCLKLQNVNNEELLIYKCTYCEKSFGTKQNFDNHENICRNKLIYEKEQLIKEVTVLKKDNESLKRLKTKYSNNLEQKNAECELLKTNIKNLQEKLDKQQETIEKLAAKAIDNAGPKTTNINNRNQIYNSLQPLTDDYMRDQTKYLTYNNIKNGAHGIAHFASNHTFKDRIACSDKSRLNFIFKNEEDNIIKDPEGVEITKRFIEINREELLRLVNEYLNYITSELMDESTSGDMYKFWADKREEFIAIRSAVVKGNVSDNEESYKEFKKNFLSALSNLVPR